MADPSSTNSKRSSRFLIPRSVVDPRGSFLAYSERPASNVYTFQGPLVAPLPSQFEEDDEKPLTRYDTIDELKGDNATVLSGDCAGVIYVDGSHLGDFSPRVIFWPWARS